jgi:hypothetical protein
MPHIDAEPEEVAASAGTSTEAARSTTQASTIALRSPQLLLRWVNWVVWARRRNRSAAVALPPLAADDDDPERSGRIEPRPEGRPPGARL